MIDQTKGVTDGRGGNQPDIDVIIIFVKIINPHVSFIEHDAVGNGFIQRDINTVGRDRKLAVDVFDHRHRINIAQVGIGNISAAAQIGQTELFALLS